MGETVKDPAEWQAASREARQARGHVAEQVCAALADTSVVGSQDEALRRIRAVAEAQRRGDQEALRAAALDASVAFANYTATLDLGLAA